MLFKFSTQLVDCILCRPPESTIRRFCSMKVINHTVHILAWAILIRFYITRRQLPRFHFFNELIARLRHEWLKPTRLDSTILYTRCRDGTYPQPATPHPTISYPAYVHLIILH